MLNLRLSSIAGSGCIIHRPGCVSFDRSAVVFLELSVEFEFFDGTHKRDINKSAFYIHLQVLQARDPRVPLVFWFREA